MGGRAGGGGTGGGRGWTCKPESPSLACDFNVGYSGKQNRYHVGGFAMSGRTSGPLTKRWLIFWAWRTVRAAGLGNASHCCLPTVLAFASSVGPENCRPEALAEVGRAASGHAATPQNAEPFDLASGQEQNRGAFGAAAGRLMKHMQ